MDLQLNGKVALVTAASKGLGKAAARQLALEGAKVVICARSDLLEETAIEISRESGVEVSAIRADMTRQQDIDRLPALMNFLEC